MNKNSISLPEAVSGREYIIDHISGGKTDAARFYGYGIFPGSKLRLLFRSPAGDPSAYEVMGTVIALRSEDSAEIYVTPSSRRQEEPLWPKP